MDPIELEFLLRALASYTEAEARTLDSLDLPVCAQNARKAAARARRIAAKLKAKEPA